MTHVDVIKNEWLAGYQVVVARLRVEDGRLQVDASEPEWRVLVTQPIVDPATGTEVRPDRPDDFLEALQAHMKGDYVFATALHDEAACPYHSMVVPLQTVAGSHMREAQPV
jgi:hypothetical protein